MKSEKDYDDLARAAEQGEYTKDPEGVTLHGKEAAEYARALFRENFGTDHLDTLVKMVRPFPEE